MGARQYRRVDQVLGCCLLIVAVLGTVLGVGAYLMGGVLLRIYSSDPQVIAYGITRLSLISAPYALCGLMDVLAGSLRGMGCSITPMITSLTGACLFRVIWIFTVFRWEHSRFMLYVSYPISWTLVLLMNVTCYLVIRKRRTGPPKEIRI